MASPVVAACAFDPDGPDAGILEALEGIRALRARLYQLDDLDEAARAQFADQIIEAEDASAEEGILELKVLSGEAKTPLGIAAKLALQLTAEAPRWLDVCFAEQGILALARHPEFATLDQRDQSIVLMITSLVRLEWSQVLAEYYRSETDFEALLGLKGAVDNTTFKAADAKVDLGILAEIAERCEACEEHFSNENAVRRLLRAIPPDFAAYKAKAKIAIKECLNDEAGPWLLRDAEMLLDCIPLQREAA